MYSLFPIYYYFHCYVSYDIINIIIFTVQIFLYQLFFLTNIYIKMSSSSASPESGLGTSHSSLPGSGHGSTNEQQINDEIYDPEILQPLGTCKALYPFDGKLNNLHKLTLKLIEIMCICSNK